MRNKSRWFLILTSVHVLLASGCYTKRVLVVDGPNSSRSPVASVSRSSRPGTTQPSSASAAFDQDSNARDFLLTRLSERGLPGISKNAAGLLEETFRLNADGRSSTSSRLFRFTPAQSPVRFFYLLVGTEEGWQLARAWKTDGNEANREEIPVD